MRQLGSLLIGGMRMAAAVLLVIGCGAAVGYTGSVPVRPGIEVLLSDSLHLIQGKRVGLVTNLAAVDSRGTTDVDLMRDAPLDLVALFGPEHGFSVSAAPGESVASGIDSTSGIPIYSLYGRTGRLTPTMLQGIDVLVVDLPDVGARYYTYVSTTLEVLRAAAAAGIPVVIADRPNPIGGAMQGNILDTAYRSAVGPLAIPMRTGITLGEEVLLAADDLGIGQRPIVVPAAGWRREMDLEQTGLPFRAPSPNLQDLEALYHYTGTCLFEGTALSVGRGTDLPFHQVGAPWLDTTAVLKRLRTAPHPGVRFEGVTFTPHDPGDAKFDGVPLRGIRLVMTDRNSYDPPAVTVAMLAAIRAVHPEQIRIGGSFDRLAGGAKLREALLRGESPAAIVAGWQPGIERYRERVQKYLLY